MKNIEEEKKKQAKEEKRFKETRSKRLETYNVLLTGSLVTYLYWCTCKNNSN